MSPSDSEDIPTSTFALHPLIVVLAAAYVAAASSLGSPVLVAVTSAFALGMLPIVIVSPRIWSDRLGADERGAVVMRGIAAAAPLYAVAGAISEHGEMPRIMATAALVNCIGLALVRVSRVRVSREALVATAGCAIAGELVDWPVLLGWNLVTFAAFGFTAMLLGQAAIGEM